jgi:SLAP domain-containing protein
MKKKLISIFLVGSLVMAIIGCGNEKRTQETKIKETKTNEAKATQEKPQVVVASNEYKSNAPLTSIDTINISPKHVYFKGSKLVMEAYVYNGYGHNVFDIRNIGIRLSNKSSVVSETTFSRLENVSIGANSYIIWTFVFGQNDIKMQNADLKYLKTEFQCDNSF